MLIIATIPFRLRTELTSLDAVAARVGGVRGSTEFRPCYAIMHPNLPSHDARYIFQIEEEAKAFAVQFGGTVDCHCDQSTSE